MYYITIKVQYQSRDTKKPFKALAVIYHPCEPYPVLLLLGGNGEKAETFIYRNAVGRGVDGKTTKLIVRLHPLEKPSAVTLSLMLCGNEKQAQMPVFPHSQNADELPAVKRAVPRKRAHALRVVEITAEDLNALIGIHRGLELKKDPPHKVNGLRYLIGQQRSCVLTLKTGYMLCAYIIHKRPINIPVGAQIPKAAFFLRAF